MMSEVGKKSTDTLFIAIGFVLVEKKRYDGRLMTFLRGCKFSLEKTKRKLDMYFTMRAAIPEFFSNRDVNRKELQDILSKV
uniref:Uncharacterized protein n=1 Tax=Timema poppense TaxID=170557 RepID=A0A7R9D8M4_TIMPO|nr:unnamed protein product [Timema poppensis]